jgi:glycosyltransferase involved in cell wall biosynthesis
MRLIIVQYAGDYREAFQNLATGKGETYYAQKYSVDAVAQALAYAETATTLCFMTDDRYDELLPNGVRAIGAGFSNAIDYSQIIQLIAAQRPTHMVLRTPHPAILKWAIQNNVQVLATLADSFPTPSTLSLSSLVTRLKNYRLAHLLNHPQINWIANHGIAASQTLEAIGVSPRKIVPWDWPHVVTPDLYERKTLPSSASPERRWNLLYAGYISDLKGVGDLLQAIAHLKARQFPVALKIAGKGQVQEFQAKVRQLQLEDCVEFLGMVPNQAIVGLMRDADLVIVPSRHEYAEGFPMTLYEGLCSRTPIVASDHPMFLKQLKHEQNAMIFPAGQDKALAQRIEAVLSNSVLYEEISQASYATWKNLQIPVKWGEMLLYWLQYAPEDQEWLAQHSLASERYGQTVEAIATEYPLTSAATI